MLKKFLDLTTFEGAMPRKMFWIYMLVGIGISLGGVVLSTLLAALLGDVTSGLAFAIMIVLQIVIVVLSLIVNFSAIVRRLHDVNLSGWWSLLLIGIGIVPVIGRVFTFVGLVALGCWPARHEKNKYVQVSPQ